MANPAREDLKQYLLLTLVGLCVVLVGLTWIDNLDDTPTTSAAFVRGTASAATDLAPAPTRVHTHAAPTATPMMTATALAPTAAASPTSPPPGTATEEPSGEE